MSRRAHVSQCAFVCKCVCVCVCVVRKDTGAVCVFSEGGHSHSVRVVRGDVHAQREFMCVCV